MMDRIIILRSVYAALVFLQVQDPETKYIHVCKFGGVSSALVEAHPQ